MTDKIIFLCKCTHKGCPWCLHASTIYGMKTVEVKHMSLHCFSWFCRLKCVSDILLIMHIKVVPAQHNCPTTKLWESKMATQGWIANMLSEWMKNTPSKRAKDAKDKVEGDYGIKLKYSKVWSGLKLALEQVHGKYEESFQFLFNLKA